MPKSSPPPTSETKKLKLKVKNLQKQLQESKNGVEFWKIRYNTSQKHLKETRTNSNSTERERERERERRMAEWNRIPQMWNCFFTKFNSRFRMRYWLTN